MTRTGVLVGLMTGLVALAGCDLLSSTGTVVPTETIGEQGTVVSSLPPGAPNPFAGINSAIANIQARFDGARPPTGRAPDTSGTSSGQ